jgi:PEP-CTERM motif
MCCADTTTTITFDELDPGGDYSLIPDSYHGLQWNNWGVIDGWDSVGGYENGVISKNNVAFAPYGDPSSIDYSSSFNLVSAYMTASWQDGLQLEVKGLFNDIATYGNTYTLNETGSTLINFNYMGIDEVDFQVLSAQQQYVMDNLVLSIPVPEPSTLALFGLGVLTSLMAFRRRKSA